MKVEWQTGGGNIVSAVTHDLGQRGRPDPGPTSSACSPTARSPTPGYVLIGVLAVSQVGLWSVIFYLLAYTFITLGAFGTVIVLERREYAGETAADYAGLARRSPFLAAMMLLFMIALTGIPPTGGFVGKFYLFAAAMQTGWTLGGRDRRPHQRHLALLLLPDRPQHVPARRRPDHPGAPARLPALVGRHRLLRAGRPWCWGSSRDPSSNSPRKFMLPLPIAELWRSSAGDPFSVYNVVPWTDPRQSISGEALKALATDGCGPALAADAVALPDGLTIILSSPSSRAAEIDRRARRVDCGLISAEAPHGHPSTGRRRTSRDRPPSFTAATKSSHARAKSRIATPCVKNARRSLYSTRYLEESLQVLSEPECLYCRWRRPCELHRPRRSPDFPGRVPTGQPSCGGRVGRGLRVPFWHRQCRIATSAAARRWQRFQRSCPPFFCQVGFPDRV